MGDETSIEADTYSYRILLLEMFLGKRPTLGLNVLELQFVILANHDQNVLVFILDLLKTRADCFSAEFSNSTQAHLTCKVLYFILSMKGKTLAMF